MAGAKRPYTHVCGCVPRKSNKKYIYLFDFFIYTFFGEKQLLHVQEFSLVLLLIGKISLTSPIVINVPSRASLAVETKGLLFLWLAHLNNKSNVSKQITSLFYEKKTW